MKKSLLVLSALLYVGIAPLSLARAQTVTTQTSPQQEDYVATQKKAEKELELAQTPEQKAEALLSLGLSYSQRKMYPQARAQWAKVLDSPGFPALPKFTAQSLVGASYGEENDWSHARTELQKAAAMPVATTQQKASLDMAIAGTFFNEGKAEEGNKKLTAIIENDEVDTNFRSLVASQLGQELVRQGKFEWARTTFSRILSVPTSPLPLRMAAHIGIAQSYKGQGDETNAQAAFVKAQGQALAQMALLAQAKRYAEARAMAEQALTIGTVAPALDGVLQTQIGDFLWCEGKPDEAIAHLDTFIKKQYDGQLSDSEAVTLLILRQTTQLKIATIYSSQGNKEKARAVLQALLASELTNPNIKAGAEKALQELA